MDVITFVNVLKLNAEPVTFMTNSLLNAVKASDNETKQTFFASDSVDSNFGYAAKYLSELQEFSAKIIAYTISRIPDYDFDKCIVNCDNRIIDDWFRANANKVGQAFILNYAAQQLGGALPNSADFLTQLSSYLADDAFINAFFIERQAASDTLSGKLILLALRNMNNGGTDFQKVVSRWKTNPLYDRLYADYDTYKWLNSANGQFLNGMDAFNKIKDASRKAIKKSTQESRKEAVPVDVGGATAIGYEYRKYNINGAAVYSWINTVGKRYLLATSSSPKNASRVKEEGGCVMQNAQILMADGTTKNVQDIVMGDLVFSVGGAMSVASNELIVNPDVTEFYAVNGDDCFMSLEHPILTQSGWKCLRPDLAKQINANADVATLCTGDVICKVKSYDSLSGKIEYENVRVETIDVKTVLGVMSYDLHFSDGYKSYHANNYCCMLNYPEITSQFVKHNIFGTDGKKETADVLNRIDELEPTLTRMFGAQSVSYVKKIAENPTVEAKPSTNKIITEAFEERIFLFEDIHFLDGGDDILSIQIINGNACITYADTDERSLIPKFSDFLTLSKKNETIYFSQDNTYFSLKLVHDGLMAQGQMLQNGRIRRFVASAKSRYDISYTDAAGKVCDLGFFTMEFEPSGGGYHAVGKFFHHDYSEDESIEGRCVFSVKTVEVAKGQKQDILCASVHIDNAVYEIMTENGYFLFEDMELDFSLDYKKIIGKGTRTENDKPKEYSISGVYAKESLLEQLEGMLANHLLEKPPLADTLYTTAKFTTNPNIQKLAAAGNLNVDDLYSISMPENISDVHSYNFNKVKNMMLYTIPEDWREVINVKKPTVGKYGDITEAECKLITENNQVNAFLVENFGKGYLSMALSQSKEEVIKKKFNNIPGYEKKLDYYWKGIDHEKCFSKNPAYSKITNESYATSYAAYVPRINDYKNDDRKLWAKRLYDYITSDPAIMLGLAIQTKEGDKTKLHHIMTMLDILDNETQLDIPTCDEKKTEKGSYSCALYYKIMTLFLADIINSFTSFDPDKVQGLTEPELKKIIEQYFRNYLEALLKGQKFQDVSLNEELQKELQAELNKYMLENAIETVDALILHMDAFIAEYANILITFNNLSLTQFNRFMQRHPKISNFLCHGANLLYFGMAICSIVMVVSNLDKMDIKSWTMFALSITGVCAMAFNSIASLGAMSILAKIGSTMPEAMNAIRILGRGARGIDMILVGVKQARGSTFNYIGRVSQHVAGGLANPNLGRIGQAAKWARIAKISQAIALGVTLVVLAACLAFCIWQTVMDFRSGQSTAILVFEIIEIVSLGITFVVEAATGIAAIAGVTVCSAIPIIGVVVMIVGLITLIVLALLPRKQPETKAEKYVDNHAKAFINALPMPSTEWVNRQEAVKNHLTGNSAVVLA